eukprot:3122580-Rhodomonas_salina.1
MLCMSVIFFSSSSIWVCMRRMPTEFSVTVSATSVLPPPTTAVRPDRSPCDVGRKRGKDSHASAQA